MDTKTNQSQMSTVDRTVLIVEDNTVLQRLATLCLAKQGINCKVAANGQEALEMWQNDNIELILMDLHMPQMNGIEATLRIRELEGDHRARTPIVGVTADDTMSKQALAAGMNDLFVKPASYSQIAMKWLSANPN